MRASADELLPAGIHPKLAAGGGQTVSRGPSALFYNPANLIFSKFIEPYLDVSYAKVDYSYQHASEEFDPALLSVAAPPVTAGLGMRFVPSFALGVAILPTGTGAAQLTKNVPIKLSGTYVPLNVTSSDTSMKIAAGAAFRFAHPFTLGVGLINSRKKVLTVVSNPADDSRIADYQYAGSANEINVGLRSEVFDRNIVMALTYKTAATVSYVGDICFLCDAETDDDGNPIEEFLPYEGVGYMPVAIGFGTEARFGMFGAYLDIVYEQWSAGRLIFRRGQQVDPLQYDLIDTINIVGGVKLWFGKHMLTGGFGIYPANMGNGTGDDVNLGLVQNDTEDDDGRIGGVQFGDLEAVPLTAFSGGYRFKLQGHGYTELGAYYASGSRQIPEGFDSEGVYSLSVLMVSAGLAFGF